MNLLLISDFKSVASEITAQVFPKTQFQVLFKEMGNGNITITFKSSTHFANNFRIKFNIRTRNLIISGHSHTVIVHLNYINKSNYAWYDQSGLAIPKPTDIGEKLELLARNFSVILPEFYQGEVFEFSTYHEFENAATAVAEQIFTQFNFSLNYRKNRENSLCLNYCGEKNLERETEIFAQQESIFFNVDFRSRAKCLAIHTRWCGEQYLLVYLSQGDLHWSTLRSPDMNTQLVYRQEFENIAFRLYPLLQEFFPG
ncbi:hypothetical protein [Iningainema tapete]|uniref:Uncharacterized protein n=1 Tax=Iningainema tapete BLCC-T55 TaxID=2748662 RepID=A0A8J6XME8_9CYAN|nr:hypothetical protein [Iningainema tapete]MBD2775842.1 hypothetical protein [Iningainema tapete BLCC-T55]